MDGNVTRKGPAKKLPNLRHATCKRARPNRAKKNKN
jgi:hypothetical protein